MSRSSGYIKYRSSKTPIDLNKFLLQNKNAPDNYGAKVYLLLIEIAYVTLFTKKFNFSKRNTNVSDDRTNFAFIIYDPLSPKLGLIKPTFFMFSDKDL